MKNAGSKSSTKGADYSNETREETFSRYLRMHGPDKIRSMAREWRLYGWTSVRPMPPRYAIAAMMVEQGWA